MGFTATRFFAATLWLASGAQAQGLKAGRVEIVSGQPAPQEYTACLIDALAKHGWVIGQNLTVGFRWASGIPANIPLRLKEAREAGPDVIVASGTQTAQAAQRTIHDIPVVFLAVSDPVKSGIVQSLSRPGGGNVTGVSNALPATTTKLIEFLRTAAPMVSRIVVLRNPANPGKALELAELEAAAEHLHVSLHPVDVAVPDDLPSALASARALTPDAIIGLTDYALLSSRKAIAEFAASEKLPSIFQSEEFAMGFAGDGPATATSITIEIVRKPVDQVGFAVHPRRWVVERFFAWISRNRRLWKDPEATLASARAFLYAASVMLLTRRLARLS